MLPGASSSLPTHSERSHQTAVDPHVTAADEPRLWAGQERNRIGDV
jgi:hypothetical protein